MRQFPKRNSSKANPGDTVKLKEYQGRIKNIFRSHLVHSNCKVLKNSTDPNKNHLRKTYNLKCICGEELVIQANYFDVIKGVE